MPTQKDVLTFLTTIKPQLQKDGIEQVGLFGSYAKNSATLTSDIDIAIKLNKNYLDKNDVWNYFNEINKIKEMVYDKFQIKSDVFDLDSASSLKDKIRKEVLYV
ncbi:MAG: nucleotidyltransferase domain-containing protein [Aliarcobacter sp.]|jgi:predicted nucleotidyltransferase|nr:nucleotidyltransferase domain-containing protein [Aliarcobacter sp.]